MKHIAFILSILLVLAACQDELPTSSSNGVEGMTEIILQSPDVPIIQTRANGDNDRDNRVENVILFAFDDQGNLLNAPVQQSVTEANGEGPALSDPTNVVMRYKVRAYLPKEIKTLYAICNHDKPDQLIQAVKDQGLQALKDCDITISQLDEAFKGCYVMTGMTTDIRDSATVIELTRVASKQSFEIIFDPTEPNESFELNRILVYNVPSKTNLLDMPTTEGTPYGSPVQDPGDGSLQLSEWTSDAVYNTADRSSNYLGHAEGMEVSFEEGTTTDNKLQYSTSFSLFENRRGGVTKTAMDEALGINDDRAEEQKSAVRQLYKRDLALPKDEQKDSYMNNLHKEAYEYASYIVLDGMYETPTITYHVQYYIYLGCNNYGDFNVIRNCHQHYTVYIKACDNVDTRVTAIGLGSPTFLVSEEPYDAHFNVREALAYAPSEFEVYVVDPDRTPWLEISTSERYVPQKLGSTNDEAASFRLTLTMGMHPVYIHTDEYVPPITKPEDNDKYPPRIGYIHCRRTDGQGELEKYYQVIQYPAQLVVTTAWDINAAEERELKFFVERFEDNDYLTYGFEKYWSNTQINLISTGLFDGLSTTRKSYAMALWGDVDSETNQKRMELDDQLPMREEDQLTGKQNAAYWTTDEAESNLWKNVPIDIALGSALAKNRDRNGNGRIDYNEILWYLPAIYQLEDIKEATIQDGEHTPTLHGTYTFPDEETNTPGSYQPWALTGNYWSITPSVSDAGGITPGRAYYMNMDKSKRAIGLRDQAFKVLVCRDANGWLGPDDASGNGNVNNDETWNEDNDHNSPR